VWVAHARAKTVVDDVLWALGLERITKARRPPALTRRGFDALVRALVRSLEGVTGPGRRAGLEAAERRLDRDWQRLTPEQREEAITAAMRTYVEVVTERAANVSDVFARHSREIVAEGYRETAQTQLDLDESPVFNAVDERVIQHAATSQAFYARAATGQISQAMSERARRIVASGLEAGHGTKEIAAELGRQLKGTEAERTRSYYEMLASVGVARARTYGQLRSYDDAAITTYEWVAVIDEVTCDTCRFLHGQKFSVRESLNRYQEVVDGDPTSVMELQPFARVVRSEGRTAIAVNNRAIAEIEESGVGQKDVRGRFKNTMSPANMQRLGVGQPPIHPRCRCVTVAVFDDDDEDLPVLLPRPAEPDALQAQREADDEPVLVDIGTPALPGIPIPLQVQVRPPATTTTIPLVPAATRPSSPTGSARTPGPRTPAVPAAPVGPWTVHTVGGRPRIGPEPTWLPVKEVVASWKRAGYDDVDEVLLERLFGKNAPTVEQVLESWSAPKLGLKAELARREDGKLAFASANPRSIGIGFVLRDEAGTLYTKEPGKRYFALDDKLRLTVQNSVLKLFDDTPKGVGEHLTANSMRLYTHLGVDAVELTAMWTGRYTWATFGFDWADREEAAGMRDTFARYLIKHGVPKDTANEEATLRAAHPWLIAAFDDGKTAPCVFHRIKRGSANDWDIERGVAPLGKAFFLREEMPGWFGELDLSSADSPSFKRLLDRVIGRQAP
jgi:SPP1 gp7 family putative phage head morphogenesis protein